MSTSQVMLKHLYVTMHLLNLMTKKIENIKTYFQLIMEELGLDLTDNSLSGTPYRVAKKVYK